MEKKHDKVELLAPAGSPQAFYGAVRAGADAVYLGGSKFGARAYAENFTQEELVTCIRYGRLFGVKVYLTVNTLLKEEELKELSDYLEPFCQAGVDAVIVQDMGVLRVIRENFPGLEIHASTQMTLCSAQGARLLREMGASRIVPARELSLRELMDIKEQVGIELETFIHGAMCYCYSGQCLFSSILGGRSGNRGRCAQPCRLPYSVRFEGISEEPFYPLSLKDMCTIEHIPTLIEAGIDSFKIEGRMKKPEYAAGVTAIYRKYIDKYYELREKLGPEEAGKAYQVEPEDARRLSTLYIRSQVQDGYYFRQNGREMVTLDNPAYSSTDDSMLEEIRRDYLEDIRKLDVEIEAEFFTGKPAKVILRRGEAVGEAVGEIVQMAQRQPVTEENLRKQLGKLGDTPFRAAEMRLQVGSDAFYPLKQMNELRRQAVQALEQFLAAPKRCRPIESMKGREYRPSWSTSCEDHFNLKADTPGKEKGWSVSVRTYEQLEELALYHSEAPDIPLRRVYVDADLLIDKGKEVLHLCGRLQGQSSCQLMAAMPYILRQGDEKYLEQLRRLTSESIFEGFLVRSLDGLGSLCDREKIGICRGDAGLYTWNSQSVLQLSEDLDGFCLPYELKASEQCKLLETPVSWEKIVYGRIPMMVTANCVLKTAERCRRGSDGDVWLTDRYKKNFPVLRNCRHCTNIIYNCVPLSLHGTAADWRKACDLRLDFTLESAVETADILRLFWRGGESAFEYTTGHEKRGVM